MREICLKRTTQWMGKDLVIHVQNENGHIGSVVIGQPYIKEGQVHVTCNTFNCLTHKDDAVASMYVKALVKKYQCTVTCICGIHLDSITKEEMSAIIEWVKKDIQKMEEENHE